MNIEGRLITKESEEQMEEDVRQAVEAARTHVAPRYAGFNLEPEIYLITFSHPGGELPCVLLPIQLAQMEDVYRRAQRTPEKASEMMLGQVLFWVRGQPEEGPRGAMKHLKALAQLVGGSFAMALGKIGNAYSQLLDEGGEAAAKKL